MPIWNRNAYLWKLALTMLITSVHALKLWYQYCLILQIDVLAPVHSYSLGRLAAPSMAGNIRGESITWFRTTSSSFSSIIYWWCGGQCTVLTTLQLPLIRDPNECDTLPEMYSRLECLHADISVAQTLAEYTKFLSNLSKMIWAQLWWHVTCTL